MRIELELNREEMDLLREAANTLNRNNALPKAARMMGATLDTDTVHMWQDACESLATKLIRELA